jgi:hypothetical protein
MYRIQQHLDDRFIPDIKAEVEAEIARLKLAARTRPGQRVAVAVGSRGIHNLDEILGTVIAALKNLGLEVFVIPSMGSHGGATAEGQKQLLEDLGVSATTVGAKTVSSMDVVSLGRLPSGATVFFSKDAMEADHIVVINRVKPHTAFRGEVESGLCKMLAVGCGKQEGASIMHTYGLAESVVPAARLILKEAPLLFGMALLENAFGRTCAVRAVNPDEFYALDKALLERAWKLLPSIPCDNLDILLVEEMGKNISGAGMDPNIIGFWRREGGQRKPDYNTLIVLDLTEQSHGNALGIGYADLTTKRVRKRIDLEATYANALTTGIWSSARLPIALKDDKTAVEAALNHVSDASNARMIRIRNTQSLTTFWATKSLLSELRKQAGIRVDGTALDLQFDEYGRLRPF